AARAVEGHGRALAADSHDEVAAQMQEAAEDEEHEAGTLPERAGEAVGGKAEVGLGEVAQAGQEEEEDAPEGGGEEEGLGDGPHRGGRASGAEEGGGGQGEDPGAGVTPWGGQGRETAPSGSPPSRPGLRGRTAGWGRTLTADRRKARWTA